ncbi:alpha/beta fold hydrolase [Solicola sp. PLA-1-18]|uniref:alpha/beta fold hydrolase n=1 Tax=Solicola sp. PLA-1-18 TaxID=3380532 RepID=UPI003B771C37
MPTHSAPHVRFWDVTSADGTRLRAWTTGGDGPTVLLCNGLGTNPYAWPGFLGADQDVRVVSWNHRGVGGSARPDDPARVDMDAFVEDALAVADAAGIESSVVIGWSMGVNVAFELAVRHPERVKGLLAVAGVPGDTFSTMLAPYRLPRPVVKAAMVSFARLGSQVGRTWNPVTQRIAWVPGFMSVLRHSGFMLPSASPEDARLAVREFMTTDAAWYGHLALSAARHARVSLSRIGVPTTFVAGRWDVLAGARDMSSAADRMPDATYVELPGTHFLPLERPAEINAELHRLIARVEHASA